MAISIGLLAADPLPDPRIELVQLQLDHEPSTALVEIEHRLGSEPARAKAMGLSYLKGRLLLEQGRRAEAASAFTQVLADSPKLSPWARLHLAQVQEAEGHPAVAAGLVATLLGSKPPKALIGPAVDLLQRSLDVAGDCRVLDGLIDLQFKDANRRRMLLARASCARRADHIIKEKVVLAELLAESSSDDAAIVAAERLLELIDVEEADTRLLLDLGSAYYQHRDFEQAVDLLERALARPDSRLASEPENRRIRSTEHPISNRRYDLARSYFWLRRYEKAAEVFAQLADQAKTHSFKANTLFQQARCFELHGSLIDPDPESESRLAEGTIRAWKRAAELFRQVTIADRDSGWASAGLVAHLRLSLLLGDADRAESSLALLKREGRAENYGRALIFLAASDLARGQNETAADRLAAAKRTDQIPDQELTYWLGRSAELDGRPKDAVEAYLNVIAENPFHPFGEAARARLGSESLRAHAIEAGEWFAAGPDPASLYKAWLVFGRHEPRGETARRLLTEKLAADPETGPYMAISKVPTAEWPLWQRQLVQPEELFLGLGLFHEPATPVLRHFPIGDPSLAFTGSTLLAHHGAIQRSLYIAEILLKRVPNELPEELLPAAFHELLYPFRYSYLIMREASKQKIDPFLLAGLIREESRFDADAFSGASARGLTQFIYPTAREIAESLEMGPISPRDIHRPEIAVALGAGYLRRLADEFDGDLSTMIAAYNAGEPQAELWKRYCYTDEPAEFWSKVAFRETRAYVRKVLTSRSHYRQLYGKSEDPAIGDDRQPGKSTRKKKAEPAPNHSN